MQLAAGAGRAARLRWQYASAGARWCSQSAPSGAAPGGTSASASGNAPAPPGGATQGAPRGLANWQVALLAGGGSAVAAGVAYLSLDQKQSVKLDLLPLGEEVFDNYDNLFVFFLDDESELASRADDIKRIFQAVAKEPELARARWHYNVRKEGDPAVPAGSGPAEEASQQQPPLKVVMYKGQRKSVLRIGDEVPKADIVAFFTPLIEELLEEASGKGGDGVARVSGNTFAKEVLAASSPGRPVLLQMFEDTCFLCFLMRPFVNSLSKLFGEYQVPLAIKRLNIEKNDFPAGCPVARGTPTFVIFRGQAAAPVKWDEFKPKELAEKISQDFPAFPDSLYSRMDELQGLVSRRFHLFTQLVMWTVELQKLEALLGPQGKPGEGQDASSDDADFNAVVAEMMSKDMQRVDGIFENIAHLQAEVDEVEHDAVLMGAMLAEAVMKAEEAEAQLLL